jgi:hypothetical protein
MKITKKFKCNKCKTVVEENGQCSCGNLVVNKGVAILKEGVVGIDCTDVSQQLLNE